VSGPDASWRGWLTIGVAVLWAAGIGSVVAVVLARRWLPAAATPAERRLLRWGFGLGIAGLVVLAAIAVQFFALAGTMSS
jgi:hypothetical protein